MRLSNLFVPVVLLAAMSAHAAADFTAPTPYLQVSDSPYAGSFAYSHLEDFEDGLLNTPGLSASGGFASGRSVFSDSVDADDGAIDGSGAAGQSWYSTGGLNYISFSFSAAVLGGLPTHVGVVFTDIGNRFDGGPLGFDTAQMEVFDANGTLQGSQSFAFGDGSALSSTAEDRFQGATWAGGISLVRVGFVHSADWEVDHVFYASAVPEPGSWALMAAGLGLLMTARRRRG